MEYTLGTGERINLTGNVNTAKFLLFVFHRLNTNFVGPVPHMVITEEIKKLIRIRQKLEANKRHQRNLEQVRQALRDEFNEQEWDDDVPF